MALSDREICKIVQKFQERLEALRALGRLNLMHKLEQLADGAGRLRIYQRQMQRALSREWREAAQRIGQEVIDRFPSLRCDFEDYENDFNQLQMLLPRPMDLAAELRQAEEEFGALVYDSKQNFVAAITEPIILKDIHLGAFEIRLLLAEPGDGYLKNMFRVAARDPHPAESDPTVTHPHVRAEILCSGHAEQGIRDALLSGRLCDFFLLVRSVLRQYNSASPHVSLDDWENSTLCFDCGTRIRDDSNCCGTCENEFCDNCISYCNFCHESICDNCLTECKGCEERVCNSCVVFCARCKTPLCKACLRNKKCPCQKTPDPEPKPEKEAEENEEQSKTTKKTRTRGGRSRTRRLPPLTVG